MLICLLVLQELSERSYFFIFFKKLVSLLFMSLTLVKCLFNRAKVLIEVILKPLNLFACLKSLQFLLHLFVLIVNILHIEVSEVILSLFERANKLLSFYNWFSISCSFFKVFNRRDRGFWLQWSRFQALVNGSKILRAIKYNILIFYYFSCVGCAWLICWNCAFICINKRRIWSCRALIDKWLQI